MSANQRGFTFYRFSIFFFLTFFSVIKPSHAQDVKDSSSLLKHDEFYLDRSDRLYLGMSYAQYNYTTIFRHISANLIGDLYTDADDDDFPKNITRWRFTPSVQRQFASVSLSSRYGSFSQSRSVDFDAVSQTQMAAYNFSIPYKNWSFTLDYLKYTGMNRTDPIYDSTKFLEDMVVRPVTAVFEYTGKGTKHIRAFSRLRGNLLNTPRKMTAALSTLFGYSSMLVQSNSDFIPALQYASPANDPNAIQMVNNKYLNKFSSTGVLLGFRCSYYLPLLKYEGRKEFRTLYLKTWIMFLYNVQVYKFYSLTDDFTNTQFKSHQKGNFPTNNLYGFASLVWDAHPWFVSAGANFYSLLYGSGSGAYYNGNSVRDQRYSFHLTAAYRIPFAGAIRKVNKVLKR